MRIPHRWQVEPGQTPAQPVLCCEGRQQYQAPWNRPGVFSEASWGRKQCRPVWGQSVQITQSAGSRPWGKNGCHSTVIFRPRSVMQQSYVNGATGSSVSNPIKVISDQTFNQLRNCQSCGAYMKNEPPKVLCWWQESSKPQGGVDGRDTLLCKLTSGGRWDHLRSIHSGRKKMCQDTSLICSLPGGRGDPHLNPYGSI